MRTHGPRSLLRDTSALAIGSVVSGLLAYVFFALVTRALGPEPGGAGLGAVGLVELRRCRPHLPAPALDHPLGHRARGRAGGAQGAGRRGPRRGAGRGRRGRRVVAGAGPAVPPSRRRVPAPRRGRGAGVRRDGSRPRPAGRPAQVPGAGRGPGRGERPAVRRRAGADDRRGRGPGGLRRLAGRRLPGDRVLALDLPDRRHGRGPGGGVAAGVRHGSVGGAAARPGRADRRTRAAGGRRWGAGRGHRAVRGVGAVPGAVHPGAGVGVPADRAPHRAGGPGSARGAAAVPGRGGGHDAGRRRCWGRSWVPGPVRR